MMVLILNVVSNAILRAFFSPSHSKLCCSILIFFFAGPPGLLVSFLTLPKTIVSKFTFEMVSTRSNGVERGRIMSNVRKCSLGVSTNKICAQQCYDDFVFEIP
jgi:hypothetical protein